MNFRFKILVGSVAIALLLAACSKGGTATPDGPVHIPSPTDTIAPVLDIQTPSNNQVFSSGNSINVSGQVTDELGLYRGSIRIVNDATGLLVKEQLYEIHYIKLYNFSISHTVNVTSPTDFTITVWYEDHGYNKTTKVVKVKVNP
jgi:hypothetical protein